MVILNISDTDRDFDPSVDMMVHDYDDERTIDEEENCSGESVENADEELDDLQKVAKVGCNTQSIIELCWHCVQCMVSTEV